MLTTLALSLVAFTTTALPQDPGTQRRGGPPLVKLEMLEIVQYVPQDADVYELEELVFEMVGREFYVEERGGFTSAAVSNVRVLGTSLILYDTRAQLDKMLEAIHQLDQPREEYGEEEEEPFVPPVTMHYVPRYTSPKSILQALESFRREVDDGVEYVPNFTTPRDRNLIVVRETEARLREIRTLIERVDVPDQQIIVTCQLVRGEDGGEDSGVAHELLFNLKAMLPDMGFKSVGFSMIQSSVAPDTSIQMLLQDETGGSYDFSFNPVAYDHQTGSLTVVKCRMQDRGEHTRHLFTTATIFRGNEYTVLGATGSQPLFVVVRVEQVDD